jgi:protein arginine kinase
MTIDELTRTPGEWLRGTGPESDIVICSRIRLARNLADFPFISRASRMDKSDIVSQVRDSITESGSRLNYFDLEKMPELDRQFLVERHLISRELKEGDGPRGMALNDTESASVMVNEEDHIRLQVMRSGFDLSGAWEQINELDDRLEENLDLAFSQELGYLTACPTNVGTGIRVGVMLHLPALGQTNHLDKFFRALQKINLSVRGLHGEGTQPYGDFYQISNQQTLGKSETELIQSLTDVIPQLIEYERKARQTLITERRQVLQDQVSRAYGVLKTAHTISSEETMLLLSSVRMGINIGLIDDMTIAQVNELFINTQPAHLQKIHGQSLAVDERNVLRASFLRKKISEFQ